MTKDDIEPDTMFVRFKLTPGGDMKVATGFNISENIPADEQGQYLAIIYGIMAMLEVEPERFIKAAAYANHGAEMADLEREQDLQEAIKDADISNLSILNFKGKMN